MPFVDLPEVRLFHVDHPPPAEASHPGALSLPTVLVHGLWDSADTWLHQLPHLRTRCRTLAVDLRGHGRTGPAADDEYSTDRHAADLAAFVERVVGGPVVLVGHSMGASVASVLAARRPDLVHALVAVDPDYAGDDDSRARLRALAEALEGPSADDTAVRLAATLAEGPETPAHLVERQRMAVLWPAPGTRARIFRHNAFHPGSVRFLPEAEAVLRRRRQPVLALHRDPARLRADERSFSHPDSKAVPVTGAGHFLHQELPGYVNAEIDRWLATLRLPAAGPAASGGAGPAGAPQRDPVPHRKEQ
ncbi:alpha/beta fold hydrolase [Streptomyces cinerochromogenes]|uniref:alpha/beta fold hydrolase n=1 Tax=Streptomyces cinerochromogenes TaxID=66422 RepID=UPI00339F72DA